MYFVERKCLGSLYLPWTKLSAKASVKNYSQIFSDFYYFTVFSLSANSSAILLSDKTNQCQNNFYKLC
jgi:hypothetical protein